MAKIPIAVTYKVNDDSIKETGGNYDSTKARVGNNPFAMWTAMEKQNYLLAQNPRIIFSKVQSASTASTSDHQPIYLWKYPDYVDNEIMYILHVIANRPIASTAQNGVIWIHNNWDMNADNPEPTNWAMIVNDNVESIAPWKDIVYLTIPMMTNSSAYRSCTNTELETAISTDGNIVILDACVQAIPLTELRTGVTPAYCNPALVAHGKKVLTDAPTQIQEKQHRLRTRRGPMVFQWYATGAAGEPTEPGDQTGLTVTNSVYVNLFDRSVTSRGADTIGSCFPAYLCGTGYEQGESGRKVKVTFRVHAGMANDGDGFIRFEGPPSFDSISDNACNIPISGGNDWYGNTDYYVYLDAQCDDNYATLTNTFRNKIDAFGMTTDSNALHVHAMVGWIMTDA